jgi:DNA-binding transcriptional LysR family regulator
MTLEQLRALHAVITEGTFHGAARRLNKSQPALSHMIKKLEEMIGFKLLSREGYRPELTASGKVFYRKALRVLEETKQLQELSRTLSGDLEEEVHLVVTATCPLPPLLGLINKVRQKYGETHIRLSIEMMGGPLEKLMEGEADIIIATADGVAMEQVSVAAYDEIDILPVCHVDYPPAKQGGMKTSLDMNSYPQIVVSDSSSGAYEQTRDLMPENQRWTVSDFAAKKEIIKSQMGWGGLPRHLIEEELKSGELVVLDLEFFPVRRSQLMLMRKREQVLGPVGRALWQKMTMGAQ